jgi:small subunit ribosomal protein S16
MAVKIRLSIEGKRNSRTFRVVAIDENKKRNGKVIEYLGFVNPLVKPQEVKINQERLVHWQKHGAIVTDAVKKLIKTT